MQLINKEKFASIQFFIYFILVFIIGNAALEYYQRSVEEEHATLTQQHADIKRSLEELLTNLHLSDLGFRGYYIVPNDKMLEPYVISQKALPEVIARLRKDLRMQGISTAELEPVEEAYKHYFNLIAQLVQWRQEEKMGQINEVIGQDAGYAVWKQYDGFNQFIQGRLQTMMAESEARTSRITLVAGIVRFMLLILGIPTLIFILIRLRNEKERRSKLFVELDQHNKKYLFNNLAQAQGPLDEKRTIDSLIYNLSEATRFITNITQGNYDIQWTGFTAEHQASNQNNLAGELLQMRQQMLKVKQEDALRIWATEGISTFAELVRQHQSDIHLLSDKLTTSVVKYLQANQASLFFAEEGEQGQMVLKLYACYAYDRKKWAEKTIEAGQGLVGQTYLEKETTYLAAVPKNYVHITSGLGEATPTSLLLVPLKFNEKVEGILEIASFKPFAPHEIDFLQKVGEIIASAVTSVRSAMDMRSLMENMQIQSEQMRAQEEEMRQNMEELQATQEEMYRKAKEYQTMIVERDALLREKEAELEAFRHRQLNLNA